MKKTNVSRNDELRPEYDFASMKGGVRAKYVKRLREGQLPLCRGTVGNPVGAGV